MPTPEEVFALHRYFLWANRQRDECRSRSQTRGLPPEAQDARAQWFRMLFVDLAPWLGSLYVVVEGWQALSLSDKRIEKLLKSPHVARLRRFRNGVFHFQRIYFDDRFLALFVGDSLDWAFGLHTEFSRYFKRYFQKRGIRFRFRRTKDGSLRLSIWRSGVQKP